jgi:metallo-beta-lactamase family protein
MKITFWGAARTVTGSMHEVAVSGKRILLDCGLYQGRRQEAFERNRNIPFDGADVDAVFLSHAHIDHSGNLPNLVRRGFHGPIFGSRATKDLAEAMLRDSAFLQEKDAEFLNRRAERRRKLIPGADENGLVEPLYTVEDAERTIPLFAHIDPCCPEEIVPGVRIMTREAGHMLGSNTVVVEGDGISLGFSGDVGRVGLPIVKDPQPMDPVDYLILESTYGDRFHDDPGNVKEKMADVIIRTAARGGKIVAPSFAVGRTQQIVLLLHELIREGRVPSIPVFVDSPLAVNVTEVFRKHTDLFDREARSFLDGGEDPFGFARLKYIRDVNESKALNELRGPFLVISASGMCEAGRILHHLKYSVSDPRNTILITGFQAENTLGRKLVQKQAQVPIFGEPFDLRADVEVINELSGHADQRELLAWMKPTVTPRLKRIFLVHGEPKQQEALKWAIEDRYAVPVEIPARGDSFTLA